MSKNQTSGKSKTSKIYNLHENNKSLVNKIVEKEKTKYIDLIVISLICLYSLIIWWPTKYLIYHWDSAGYVISAAQDLYNKNFSTLIPDVGLIYAHPPLFTALLALIWKIFGISFLASHLTSLPFLPLLMISTYFIGKKIGGLKIAIASAFLSGMSAIVVSEYGLVYIDLPVAALTTLTLVLWFYKKYILAGTVMIFAVLIKLPAALILPVLALSFFEDKKNKKDWKFYFSIWLPSLFIGLWLWYHYQETSWLLFKPDRPSPSPKNISQAIESFFFVCRHFFVTQNKWILLSILFLSTFYLYLNNKLKSYFNFRIIQLLVLIVIGVGFFIWAGEFSLRYGMFMIPAYILLTTYFLEKISKSNEFYWLVVIIIGAFLVAKWHPKLELTTNYEFRASEDMSYLDYIRIGKEAAKYLEVNFPRAILYGSFPESYQVTQPYQGYVRKAFEFYQCKDFKLENKTQVLYLHPYSPGQYFCRVLLEKIPTKELTRFQSNGKWLELYLVTATKSAVKK